MAHISSAKARKILRDKTIRGKKLTKGQKGLFGLIASGKTPSGLGKIAKRIRKRNK